MAITLLGPRDWPLRVDPDGHRNYQVTYLLSCDDNEGPYAVSQYIGLPVCGDPFTIEDSEGTVLDEDPFAFAGCEREIKKHRGIKEGSRAEWYEVTVPFSTKPRSRCCDTDLEDPLTEPAKISISTETFTYEAAESVEAKKIAYSSHEQIHGPLNEWEDTRIKVTIKQNVAQADLPLLTSLRNGVNETAMWGMEPRTIRLSSFSLEPKYQGASCLKYWERTLVFDVRFEGQDREVPDEGTMALNGHWGTNTGSGATVTLTTTSGTATIATLGSGGTAYPKSSALTMLVTGGDSNCQVKATTNALGVITAVTLIDGGTGYSNGSTGLFGGSGWILDLVPDPCGGSDKVAPDPNNPAHFSRYLDRAGNPSKVVFDCVKTGQPYDPCEALNEEGWWCLHTGVLEYSEPWYGTCYDAVTYCIANGLFISGPYDTEALAVCTIDDCFDPDEFECHDQACQNFIQLKVYGDQDLFALGIPIDLEEGA